MKHNYFGYMRISTKEERQKQSYIRQEVALNCYAENNGFEGKMFLENLLKTEHSGKSWNS